MGEEVDAVLMKKVKQTQEILGPFVRKPPLTEKHLMKPPFRFLHDIITNVMENTGFFQGLYDGPELDPSSISTRETKTAWMTKLVDCLKLATDEDVDVKVSKILAGQEPAKTNDLLISLGNALAKGISSDKAVAIVTGKDPNSAAASKGAKAGDPAKKTKKDAPKIKEASPYGQSLQKKPGKAPPKGKPSEGEKTRRVSKPTEVPGASKTPGRQSKAGMSTSPPKAPSKAPQTRQPSSDRKTTKREGISPARSSTSLRGDRKDGRRLSSQISIEEAGPPSLNDQGDIMDETAAAGSRRGSLTTSAAKEPRGSSTYRQPTGSHRGSLSGPSGDVTGSESGIGTFTSPEAHLDDAEQAEFMGELEFLLNKQHEGGLVESDGDHDDDDDVGGGGAVGEMIAKTDKGDNNNFPGSSTAKESAAGKMSHTPTDIAVEPADDVDHNDDDDDDEKILSSSALPTARKQSAAVPSSSRIKSSSSPSIEPQYVPSPTPSTSALSVSNAVLGTLSPSPTPTTAKHTPEPPETLSARPPTARPHTSQMRPGGSNTTVSILRPPSARPAPPRPKTALFQDKEEAAFRPTTAKVHNVLLDEDEPDDENYIVHEVGAPEQSPGELQLNETGDLGIRGNIMEENIDLILDPEQRGLLVNQMLDAQSRLEDGSRLAGKKTEIEREGAMGEKDRLRWREDAAAEVEKLKNLMQLMARNANPLGKLMDFVQEDVDAMQRDLNKWKEESRKLDQALEAAQEETEQSMEPLRRRMAELDEAIQDRLDAIAATKMTIFRQEERIRKVLMGLDKVKARSGNEPKLTSADITNLIEPDQEGYDFGGNKVYFKKSNPSPSPSPVNFV